jgi:transcription-repair coupling factor (superfamily II helicase)
MTQILSDIFQIQEMNHNILWVLHDEHLALEGYRLAQFFLPKREILFFPAWDTLPYDRVSPSSYIMGQRLGVLSKLLQQPKSLLLISTPHALMQKIPPKDVIQNAFGQIKIGDTISLIDLSSKFLNLGYRRVECVREPGEFSIRGGIFDVSIPQMSEDHSGFRLDFFGDTLENIRVFDLATQLTLSKLDTPISFSAASEVCLTPQTIESFRVGYRALFDKNKTVDDPLYSNISAGNPYPGMEHWLPLFYPQTTEFKDYLNDTFSVLEDPLCALHWGHRKTQYEEHYISRLEYLNMNSKTSVSSYFPVNVRDMIAENIFEWENTLERKSSAQKPFGVSLETLLTTPQKTKLVALSSKGSLERLKMILTDKGVRNFREISSAQEMKPGINLLELSLSSGFVHEDLIVLSEEDLFGEKLIRGKKSPRKRAEEVLMEASSLVAGDFVVHEDHGVGKFLGLQEIPILKISHDCIALEYAGGDKLYVPVENINMLTRYGSDNLQVDLDRLGSGHWQLRKAKVKNRIQEIAHKLIALEAERQMKEGRIYPKNSAYDLFVAQFPYIETDDQERAIGDILDDLSSGKSMDRLICGDVGYGKTEVAMRAAFLVASAGAQVAIIAPTTLLCRQHFKNFVERFASSGIKIAQLSRLVPAKEASQVYKDLEDGKVDIVIATHALFKDRIKFKDLGLVIIDEEQHFGVAQKEKLKMLAKDVHLLTLSATPIPRTLHMALSGLRSMSIIATPPVDRVAIRTFVLPFDPIILKEALLREHYRGGQSFYVCPRIDDLEEIRLMLEEMVPQLKVNVANGQMKPKDLEDVMTSFCDGQAHILLATNIIESGIDLSSVNTIIIHNANLFGLSQLYQLRGRVGRSKIRAYAYLTTPNFKKGESLSDLTMKRLEVMGTLDSLGAGFRVASHDMDLRGTGNLIGSEQSGQIREIGVELYQQLLKEAIEQEKTTDPIEESFNPEITISIPIYIPEEYIKDLKLRMTIYRRLGGLLSFEEVDHFMLELLDRFGKIPVSVENLLSIIRLKIICKSCNIEKCDIGPKGAVLTFYKNTPKNIDSLLSWVQNQKGLAKLRPDGKLTLLSTWDKEEKALIVLQRLLVTFS